MHHRFTRFKLDIDSPLAGFSWLIHTTIKYACWKTGNQRYKQLLMLKQLFNTKHKQQSLANDTYSLIHNMQRPQVLNVLYSQALSIQILHIVLVLRAYSLNLSAFAETIQLCLTKDASCYGQDLIYVPNSGI